MPWRYSRIVYGADVVYSDMYSNRRMFFFLKYGVEMSADYIGYVFGLLVCGGLLLATGAWPVQIFGVIFIIFAAMLAKEGWETRND